MQEHNFIKSKVGVQLKRYLDLKEWFKISGFNLNAGEV